MHGSLQGILDCTNRPAESDQFHAYANYFSRYLAETVLSGIPPTSSARYTGVASFDVQTEVREGVNVTGQVRCKNTGEGIVAYLEKSHGYVAADVLGKCVGIDLHHMTFELSFGLN